MINACSHNHYICACRSNIMDIIYFNTSINHNSYVFLTYSYLLCQIPNLPENFDVKRQSAETGPDRHHIYQIYVWKKLEQSCYRGFYMKSKPD